MKDGAWLIMSGAFVGQELAAEFGQLPPAFLPVGVRRLYEYQLERIGTARPVYITLPESFEVPSEDVRILAERHVTILLMPERLTLGEAVVFALNLISNPDHPLLVLHGDTLVDDLPDAGTDWIGIVSGGERYSWAEVDLDGERVAGLETVAAGVATELVRPIVCGLFSFAHSAALVRGITRARGDFIGGILDYAKEHPLRAVAIPDWYDFGHVQTYFRSRRVVTSARYFNTVRVDGRTARKTGHDGQKIRAEAAWLAAVPPPLRIYCARLIDAGEEASGAPFYETEYGYLPTLSELFVFGRAGRPAWLQILQCCRDFLLTCATITDGQSSNDLLHELAITKMMSRLEQFAVASGFDVTVTLRYNGHPMPALMTIAQDIAERVSIQGTRSASVMHGDFCFSNILYDSRVGRIRVIDPRGYVRPGEPTVFGDSRYDLAKLAHSVIGRYDQIIAGRYHLSDDGLTFESAPHHIWLQDALDDFEISGTKASGQEIRALTIGLFLSMLPLHSDRPDRQRAFMANALRLYSGLETSNG